mmetsp:Transcript_11165/g.46874  ORF Transcript_11165/g.46874 Transcript_11165/m.46874 type:complete len:366 (-) Transcript_11165:51-1148(-)
MSTIRRVPVPNPKSGANPPRFSARADSAFAAASRAAFAAASAAATAPPPLFATAISACTAAFCATTRSRCSFAMCAFRWNASHFAWSPFCAASRSADAAAASAAASARKDASSMSFGHEKDSVRGASPSSPPSPPVEEGTCTTRSAKVSLYAASRSRVSEASRSARRASSSSSAETISSGLSCATAASTSTPSRSSCSRRKRSALLSVSTGSLSARGASATRRRALEANADPRDRSPRRGRTGRPRWRFVLTSEESEARADGVATGRAAIALAVIARMSPASARWRTSWVPRGAFDARPFASRPLAAHCVSRVETSWLFHRRFSRTKKPRKSRCFASDRQVVPRGVASNGAFPRRRIGVSAEWPA